MVPRPVLGVAVVAAVASLIAIDLFIWPGPAVPTAHLPAHHPAWLEQRGAADAAAIPASVPLASGTTGDLEPPPDPRPLRAAEPIIPYSPLPLPAAEYARALNSPDLADSERAADTPGPAASFERPPFALSLLLVDLRYGVSQAVSPITYPDRAACELAGRQWLLEVVLSLSGVALTKEAVTCVSQAGDLQAMLARHQAARPAASTVP